MVFSEDDITLLEFTKKWQDMGYYNLFDGRSSESDKADFIESCFHILVQFFRLDNVRFSLRSICRVFRLGIMAKRCVFTCFSRCTQPKDVLQRERFDWALKISFRCGLLRRGRTVWALDWNSMPFSGNFITFSKYFHRLSFSYNVRLTCKF